MREKYEVEANMKAGASKKKVGESIREFSSNCEETRRSGGRKPKFS